MLVTGAASGIGKATALKLAAGVYSPGLDPLTVLGIEARNEEERRYFAEKQVQAEAARVEKELAYQLAYDAAWQRLFPTLQPINDLEGTTTTIITGDGRLAVFVKENCPLCDQQVKLLQAKSQSFDVYMVDSRQDDIAVRRWASKVNINPDKVRTGSRVSGQLSGEGDSAAFREFAWRFINVISRALVELGHRPDYLQIQRHVINIDALFIEYAQHFFAQKDSQAWNAIIQIEGKLNDKNIPRNMVGREKRVIALDQYLTSERIYDPVLDGLKSAVRYDKTYFDKIVASLLPLLEKLTTGKIAQLLAPNYSDLNDPRPIIDWMQVIRQRAIVYIGLAALSDTVVASAVGNSMFADLVSVAGHIYKHGLNDGLPEDNINVKASINLHADEFNELMGSEFIPLVNKGGGAGIQVTAYTQTLSDIEARIGNSAKAGQVIGNFNNLVMLRVRENATAELLTKQLPKVEVYSSLLMSGATDTSDPTGTTSFTSNTVNRVTATSVPMLEPSHIVGLPKGQAFALLEGGQLWKIRMPLPVTDPGEIIPKNIQSLADYMRSQYIESGRWWEQQIIPTLHSEALPADLVEDFKHLNGEAPQETPAPVDEAGIYQVMSPDLSATEEIEHG